jgi:hypothetical protein
MKFLIYLVSFGADFRHFTQMALNSIREVGRWQHDIVVLCDGDRDFGNVATVINILPDLQKRYPGSTPPPECACRIASPRSAFTSISKHDYVLY